jgi:metal-responsive CopG/Arc/MetJ family transcriptional regulator
MTIFKKYQKKQKQKRYKFLGINIPQNLWDMVELIAMERGVTKTRIVEEVLKKELSQDIKTLSKKIAEKAWIEYIYSQSDKDNYSIQLENRLKGLSPEIRKSILKLFKNHE